MKWEIDVKEALKQLGGEAHLSDIYPIVKRRREKRGDSLGKYKNWVSHTLQNNSRGDGSDIFEPVYPTIERKGIWRLKDKVKDDEMEWFTSNYLKFENGKTVNEPVKHLYSILYYMEVSREKDNDWNRIEISKQRKNAKEKTGKKFEKLNPPYQPLENAFSQGRGLNLKNQKEFDSIYKDEGLHGILDLIFDRWNLNDDTIEIFNNLKNINDSSDTSKESNIEKDVQNNSIDISQKLINKAKKAKVGIVKGGNDSWRLGRGFSRSEITKVNIDLQVKKDTRRNTCHKHNIKILEMLNKRVQLKTRMSNQ